MTLLSYLVDLVRDVMGLYMTPPGRTLVLCVGQKSKIQAMDRTQYVLPLTFGKRATRTHNNKRHGSALMLATLDVATGKFIGQPKRHHRSTEFLQLLNAIDAAVPSDEDIQLIMDNYGTHKNREGSRLVCGATALLRALHADLGVLVQLGGTVLRAISQRWIKRNARTSVADLEDSIRHYFDTHKADPKPFV